MIYIYKIAFRQYKGWTVSQCQPNFWEDYYLLASDKEYEKAELTKLCEQVAIDCAPKIAKDFINKVGESIIHPNVAMPSKTIPAYTVCKFIAEALVESYGFQFIQRGEEIPFTNSLRLNTDVKLLRNGCDSGDRRARLSWHLNKAYLELKKLAFNKE